jgi:phenylacetic acid degradation operon negative regulatory protein
LEKRQEQVPLTKADHKAADDRQSIVSGTWDEPPRAASFIVTIYGDVVDPRGGVLWIGNLIEVCAAVGISESLVRTAVSRLVAAGQLAGERAGRRSFYRLTPEARAEYLGASRVLFAPEPPATAWLFLPRPDSDLENRLLREGFSLAGGFLLGPDRKVAADIPGPVFRAEIASGLEDLPEFAGKHWDLSAIDADYRAFLDRFTSGLDALRSGTQVCDRDALLLRLMLVHDYRTVLLRDPRLPLAALPQGWAGESARTLFADLYCALSDQCGRDISRHLLSDAGHLPEETETTRKRLQTIHRSGQIT